MCTDGKKGRYVNNLECSRSGEDYSGFQDRDRGKPCKFCEKVFDNENCTNYFGRSVDKKSSQSLHKKPVRFGIDYNGIGVSWQKENKKEKDYTNRLF